MAYVIEISHKRGASYWIDWDRCFGSIRIAKKFQDKEQAQLALQNIQDYMGENASMTAYYLGYQLHTLRVLEVQSISATADENDPSRPLKDYLSDLKKRIDNA